MKSCKLLFILLLVGSAARAQFIVGTVLNETVGRVIRAIDLKVQRLQTQTIWLQNTQRVIENELSQLKLTEIAGYNGQQQTLFSQYYSELWQVKSYLSTYQKVKNITVRQANLVAEYQRSWSLFHNDSHFTATELNQMQKVYSGILTQSLQNMDQVMQVITPSKTQMSDEQRMELINKFSNELDGNYADLQQFNRQNQLLSLERAKDQNEVNTLKQYYGIH